MHYKEKVFVCSHCGKTFMDQSNRNRHERLDHALKPVRHKCDVCPNEVTFGRKDNLKLHLKRIHGIYQSKVQPSNLLSCDHCSVTYGTKIQINKHIKLNHLQDNPKKSFKCTICFQEYKLKEGLLRHLNGKHLKKFCCQFCCKALTSKKNLIKHEARGKCKAL